MVCCEHVRLRQGMKLNKLNQSIYTILAETVMPTVENDFENRLLSFVWPADFIAVMSDTERNYSVNINQSTVILLSQESLVPVIKLFFSLSSLLFFIFFVFLIFFSFYLSLSVQSLPSHIFFFFFVFFVFVLGGGVGQRYPMMTFTRTHIIWPQLCDYFCDDVLCKN